MCSSDLGLDPARQAAAGRRRGGEPADRQREHAEQHGTRRIAGGFVDDVGDRARPGYFNHRSTGDLQWCRGLRDRHQRGVGVGARAGAGEQCEARAGFGVVHQDGGALPPGPGTIEAELRQGGTAADGAKLLLRWYTKAGSQPGSAVYYVHGGGMILSNVEIYDGPVARYVSASGVPFLAVEYRYAPEFPHPVPVEDCYAGLQWMVEHAGELGIDPARIAVMGDSGGGGVGGGLVILARDRGGPAIAKQILIYPMLDDRNTTPDARLVPFVTWSYDDNVTGWGIGRAHV